MHAQFILVTKESGNHIRNSVNLDCIKWQKEESDLVYMFIVSDTPLSFDSTDVKQLYQESLGNTRITPDDPHHMWLSL